MSDKMNPSSSSGDVLTTPLTTDDLQYLSREFKEEWQNVARNLGISDADIYNLRSDYARNSETEVKYQMLVLWRQRRATKATRDELAEAIRKTGKEDLAIFVLTGVKPQLP